MNGSYHFDKIQMKMYIYEEYPNCHKYTVYKGGEYKCNNCGVNWLTLEEQDREAFINLS